MRTRFSRTLLGLGALAATAMLMACNSNSNSNNSNANTSSSSNSGAAVANGTPTGNFVAAQGTTPGPAQIKPVANLIVGAIHVGSETDNGYNQAMHEGLLEMEKNLPNVKVIEAENVATPDVSRVIEDMISKGAKLIFPMNFDYQDPALAEAQKHPDVVFEHPAGFKLAPNFGTFWADNLPQEYIMGQIAAKSSKSGKLGWVIGFPIPNILESINAFEIGAKSVNPGATTQIIVDDAWVDSAKEQQAVRSLHDQGVDVVAMLVDSPATVVKTADQLSMKTIGFHCLCLQAAAGNSWLSGVGFDWGALFTTFAKQRMDGTWRAASVFGTFGGSQDYAKIAPFGPSVDDATKTLVQQTTAALQSGKLQVFQGPIVDNTGKTQIPAGQVGDPAALSTTTNWVVQGVSGKIN